MRRAWHVVHVTRAGKGALLTAKEALEQAAKDLGKPADKK